MHLTFDHDGQRLDIRLSPLGGARVRRLLAPRVVEAREALIDLSGMAKVRHWARANGYEERIGVGSLATSWSRTTS